MATRGLYVSMSLSMSILSISVEINHDGTHGREGGRDHQLKVMTYDTSASLHRCDTGYSNLSIHRSLSPAHEGTRPPAYQSFSEYRG